MLKEYNQQVMLVVIDSFGIGSYEPREDDTRPNTLHNAMNAAKHSTDELINFRKLGLNSLINKKEYCAVRGQYGRTRQLSPFCESYAAHWEMNGYVTDIGYDTHLGVDENFLAALQRIIGHQLLGNLPYYQETKKVPLEVIKESMTSGDPILLTEERVESISTLSLMFYDKKITKEGLEIVRDKIQSASNYFKNIGRIILKTYTVDEGNTLISAGLRINMAFFKPTIPLLSSLNRENVDTIAIGKVCDIFNHYGFQTYLEDWDYGNVKKSIYDFVGKKNTFVFANLNDLRRPFAVNEDPVGWSKKILDLDNYIGQLIEKIDKVDTDVLLIVTGDHGSDPTMGGIHDKEWNPLFLYSKNIVSKKLGEHYHQDIGATVAQFFSAKHYCGEGKSFQ